MKFAIGEMTVGDILDRGLKIMLARLPTFFAIDLIVLAPLFVVQTIFPIVLLSDKPGATPDMGVAFGLLGMSFFVLLLTLILAPLGTAAILHVISQEFIERRASLGEALRVGLARFAPLLGASIVAGFGIVFGLVACIVPGLIFMVWWAFITQVVVVERQGALESLGRSKQLVEGYGWRVFGVLLLVGIINIVIQSIVQIPLSMFLNPYEVVKTNLGPQQHLVSIPYLVINNAVMFCITVVLQAFQASCMTLLYFDLRIRKEGFDLELLALDKAGARFDKVDREVEADDLGGGRREDDEPEDESFKPEPRS
jgi:hypothetical protein